MQIKEFYLLFSSFLIAQFMLTNVQWVLTKLWKTDFSFKSTCRWFIRKGSNICRGSYGMTNLDIRLFETIGRPGKKRGFSAAVKRSRGKLELQLPSAHTCPSSLVVDPVVECQRHRVTKFVKV